MNKPTEPRRRKTLRGRESVKEAILGATAELLLKHSPSEISVRAIADRAGVKHPLIYRHFGSKNALILAVHMREVREAAPAIAEIENIEGNLGKFFATLEGNRWRQVSLARAMIDGVDPRLLQDRFPVMERLVKLLGKRLNAEPGSDEPKLIAAALGAAAIGWMIFQPFLEQAAGLNHLSKSDQRDAMVRFLEDFVSKTVQNR